MLTIGMLGGMSWESSAEYYRLANVLVRERLGGLHSAKVVLHSVDFAEIERMQVEGRWDDAGKALAEAATSLQAGGADFLVLCTNTMHKVFDEIQAAVGIPMIHLGDTTADAIKKAGLTTVGLLGTGFTMDQPFYRERLESHGLTVLLPSTEDRETVHRIIYDELCLGVVRDESRRAYQDVIARFEGAEGVILGCTEIELLLTQDDVPLPVFPTTRLHVEAAVERAILPDNRGTPTQSSR
ncbi:aspartate/glutamate racemase family protein [Lentzea sp. PSKA42]|uniref:Aspartate/glutamate racemase family protein n=1 Tax=Lentzea indica TaxID=2604800 RepID=A0ABX1FKV9_9PSEU|nr:aspartate/glutamate racemase family protein [Lentzea indica]NKE59582.1 aspartate/glutamate racemase family protein [Lentzea indica]